MYCELLWACATHKQFTMQAVAVAIAKAAWAWVREVRGKCEEAMREVLGAGRGVQAGEVETPAMAAEAGRDFCPCQHHTRSGPNDEA